MWSVTNEIDPRSLDLLDFNSHAHVERDDITTFFTETIPDFNSHAHVERDNSKPEV